MRLSFRLVAIVVLSALGVALAITFYQDSQESAAPGRLRSSRSKRVSVPALGVYEGAGQPLPMNFIRYTPPPPGAAAAPEPQRLSTLSEDERRTLIRYANADDLRASAAPELGGQRLHQILDDGLASDSILIAGAIVMHQAQNHSTNSARKCWDKSFVAKMMQGKPHYSARNAHEMAQWLWEFEQVEESKDLALDLLMRHDHVLFADTSLRADFHTVIGLCKRSNPRYPDNEARREFRTASALYEELAAHGKAASTKLEEIKALMDADDVVRDRQELTEELAACKKLLTDVAKEDSLWGRYCYIEGRFHRDLYAATKDPVELTLSEQRLRDAKMHKKEHKAEKDGSYYNLLIIHAEACLLLAITRPVGAEENLQTSIDDLLEVINGNSSEVDFNDYSYGLMVLESACAKAQKFPLYLELLQQHHGRKSDAPGLAAAIALERERMRRLIEERSRNKDRQPAEQAH